MSTVADRPTVGQMLADTQESHQKQEIEVGEFIEEVGNKEVMKEVWRQIDARKGLPQWNHKFYILVYFHKDHLLHRVMHCEVQSRHSFPEMNYGLTCFSFEPKTDNLLLEWVLPNKSAVPMFLKNRANTDEFLIHCIEKMQKLENGYQKV